MTGKDGKSRPARMTRKPKAAPAVEDGRPREPVISSFVVSVMLPRAALRGHWGTETAFRRLEPLDLPRGFRPVWDGWLLGYLGVPFAYQESSGERLCARPSAFFSFYRSRSCA